LVAAGGRCRQSKNALRHCGKEEISDPGAPLAIKAITQFGCLKQHFLCFFPLPQGQGSLKKSS